MSADIVTVGFCPQYYSTFSVQGSGGSVYTVSLAGTGFAHCDCPAYAYFKGEPADRTCKHIKAVWEHGCFYNPQWKDDAGPNDLSEVGASVKDLDTSYTYGEPCPGCGDQMIATKIAV